jgi:hypothetical protein
VAKTASASALVLSSVSVLLHDALHPSRAAVHRAVCGVAKLATPQVNLTAYLFVVAVLIGVPWLLVAAEVLGTGVMLGQHC